MDTSVAAIEFDENGICSFCSSFLSKYNRLNTEVAIDREKAEALHAEIRRKGRGKRYDCIVGVSGGADSSYALYQAVKNGLRPLAVHLDNGWNSELAQKNIENLVRKLGVDLYTHVIDWEENRLLQLSFLEAGVIDIEMIMDNAQAAVTYQQASKYGLKYILSGVNTKTEGMPIPEGWYHYKFDVINIKSINQAHRRVKILTHPLMNTLDWMYYEHVKKIKYLKYLDYFNYDKIASMKVLTDELGYVPYRYKHNESIFTRFYQNYILPQKFRVDKRRVHHSNLICTGQMSRDEALMDLSKNEYLESGEASKDRDYVLKKFDMSEQTFVAYMARAPVEHSTFRSEVALLRAIIDVARPIKRFMCLLRGRRD